MIGKLKILPIIMTAAITTATLASTVSCSCTYGGGIKVVGGNTYLNGTAGYAGQDDEQKVWVARNSGGTISSATLSIVKADDSSQDLPDGLIIDNGIVKWPEIEMPNAFNFRIKAEWEDKVGFSDIICLNIRSNDNEAKLEGGKSILQIEPNTKGSTEDNPWKVMYQGEQLTEGISWGLIEEQDTDDIPEGIQIKTTGKDGIISWDGTYTPIKEGTYNFSIKATINSLDPEVILMARIALIVSTNHFALYGGNTNLDILCNDSGQDTPWVLYNKGIEVPSSEYTLSFVGSHPQGIQINDQGYISWSGITTETTGSFTIKAVKKLDTSTTLATQTITYTATDALWVDDEIVGPNEVWCQNSYDYSIPYKVKPGFDSDNITWTWSVTDHEGEEAKYAHFEDLSKGTMKIDPFPNTYSYELEINLKIEISLSNETIEINKEKQVYLYPTLYNTTNILTKYNPNAGDEDDFVWYRYKYQLSNEFVFERFGNLPDSNYDSNYPKELRFSNESEDKMFNFPIFSGNNATTIDAPFLTNNTKFNSPIDFRRSSNYSITDDFLSGCTNFNSLIELGGGCNFIGSGFMNNCTSYNPSVENTIRLWANIQYIGPDFMVNCNKLKYLIIACDITKFDQSSDYTLTRSIPYVSDDDKLHIDFLEFAQDQGDIFMNDMFPEIIDLEHNVYRQYAQI